MSEQLPSYGPAKAAPAPFCISVRLAENGVIVAAKDGPQRFTEHLEQVFTEAEGFGHFMRAWFISHHGDKAVTQLPLPRDIGQRAGFAQNGEG